VNTEAFYLTLGLYDTVAVVTLPDDATMAKLAARFRRRRERPHPEYHAILASL
jgi:uncharacterized protein with GYD domain